MRRIPWITLILAGLACLVHESPALSMALEFQRTAITIEGEAWRLLTGHLTHFGANHLKWDVAALLILGQMTEHDNRRSFVGTLIVAAFAIGLGVWVLQPQFLIYRGLSGLDSALYALVCARLIVSGVRARHGFSIAVGALAIAGFILKCGAELSLGATVFAENSAASYAPVPLAHLIGLVIGLTGALVERPSQPNLPNKTYRNETQSNHAAEPKKMDATQRSTCG